MPEKFVKKPVEIEAMRFTDEVSGREIADWCGGRLNLDVSPRDPTDIWMDIAIPTLEGVMKANRGDWIIRGVKGEFYPCKPDIFEATYERATAAEGD